jgi:acyl-CoA thioesterase-1
MVGGNQGLTRALEQRFSSEGARFIRDYKVSESIVSYDHSPKLKELVAKHHPDIVLITLGTNDVFVPYPASMAGNVQNIVKRVGARECYWLGPPTWKPDTGIVQVLRENVAPCKFYDASSLKLQRAGDGIHPTDRGGADWATSFWAFFRPASSGAVEVPLLGDAGAP